MCGIAGVFAYQSTAPRVDEAGLLQIREAMAVRGPDGAGLWMSADKRVGLAHRRLAIIDLSEAGAQPMATLDGRFRVVFNGEIYNYRELRRELEAKGYRFRSASDTEVLLHLYAERGREMVHVLRGMFAFAIWDDKNRRLFLARDPFGIKPLYYSDDGSTVRFASQVKALLKGGRIDTAPQPAGHVGFFLWGYVPEPFTLYKAIRSLPAGSTLWIDEQGRHEPVQYFSVTDECARAGERALQISSEEVRERLQAALLDSVRHHLVADVPVGVFLSSGLDSSTVTALASELGQGSLHTITLGFGEYKGSHDDETPLAARVAAHYGTAHQTKWVSRSDFDQHLDNLLEVMDQPSIDGVNSYFVSKVAAEAGMKVALSGLGGDELFGGYPSFRDVPRMVNALALGQAIPGLGRAFRWVSAPILKHVTSPKYAGLLEYGGSYSGAYLLRRGLFMPWELPDIMDGEMVKEGWQELQPLIRLEETIRDIRTDRLRVSALELTWYMRNQLLRDADWAGMAHSLEIRTPLVDVELFRRLVPLMGMASPPTKLDMARSPAKALPEEIFSRRKTGFSVPVREWLQGEDPSNDIPRGLREWARTIYNNGVGKKILVLTTDAFGGHGGIANYNRDLLSALCRLPYCRQVIALPRLAPNTIECLPEKLTYVREGLNGKIKYLAAVLKVVRDNPSCNLIICSHINLIPVAVLLRLWLRVPVVLFIYGIEAWQPSQSWLCASLVRKIDCFVSISEVTRTRFLIWTKLRKISGKILPNAIHLECYGPGPKNAELLKKYDLTGRTVLMTLGRLEASERYKGFDEIIELLPDLIGQIQNISYLIVGNGSDRDRLEQKAKSRGLQERVVFAGLIPENQKADHYRLADAYVMPSSGEGFGFVFLEAMACGIPVVGGKLDGSREALRDGMLGILVNPDDPEDIKRGILEALKRPKGVVPEGLEYFSYQNFEQRVHGLIGEVLNAHGKEKAS